MWNPETGTGYGVQGLGMSTSVVDVLYELRGIWSFVWIIIHIPKFNVDLSYFDYTQRYSLITKSDQNQTIFLLIISIKSY